MQTHAIVHAAAGFLKPMEFNMKSTAVVCAIVAMSLSAGGVAFAQGGTNENNEFNRNGQAQRAQQNNRAVQQGNRANQARQQSRPDNRGPAFNQQREDERGAGPDHNFRRGGRLPTEYRHNQYVVDDWRGHQLSAPPRGYHWVQTGSDYVLVAIATGIIAQLLLSH